MPTLWECWLAQTHFLTIDTGHDQARSSDHLGVEVQRGSRLVTIVHKAKSELSQLLILLSILAKLGDVCVWKLNVCVKPNGAEDVELHVAYTLLNLTDLPVRRKSWASRSVRVISYFLSKAVYDCQVFENNRLIERLSSQQEATSRYKVPVDGRADMSGLISHVVHSFKFQTLESCRVFENIDHGSVDKGRLNHKYFLFHVMGLSSIELLGELLNEFILKSQITSLSLLQL